MNEKANCTIWLDEKLQIVRQNINGLIDEEDAKKISNATRAAARELKDPRRVRILAVSSNKGKIGSKARKILMNDLKDTTLYKMAFVENNPYLKALISFVFILTGVDKVRIFSNEKDAVDWLTK